MSGEPIERDIQNDPERLVLEGCCDRLVVKPPHEDGLGKPRHRPGSVAVRVLLQFDLDARQPTSLLQPLGSDAIAEIVDHLVGVGQQQQPGVSTDTPD